ncbi:MAG: hypothetical protein FJ137_16935 [Deltaproteobacteria bacterium]|nr:hypothetical protein [Deltaproteobacteria bacterium]
MSPLSSGDERNRMAAGVFLLGAVHVALFLRGGNDSATPLRLLVSFAATVGILLLAQRARRRVQARVRARQRAPDAPSPPSSDATTEVPR